MTNLTSLDQFLQNDLSESRISKNKINLYKLENLKNKSIYVYGFGKGYITLKTFLLDKYKLSIKGVLDRIFEGNTLGSEENLFDPKIFKLPPKVAVNTFAIISVGKPRQQSEIRQRLKEIGFKNIITAFEVYEYHLSHESTKFSKNPISSLIKDEKKIAQAYTLLADSKSKAIYRQLLKIYAGLPTPIIEHDPIREQYFPKNVPLAKGKKRFINCGSFDGDTVRELVNINGPIESLACFEPDLESYTLLSNFLSSHCDLIANKIVSFPCGVHEKNQRLYFNTGKKMNSSFSIKGDSLIQCVAIDSAIPNFNPTYINMDVEGSELEAIQGASRIIKTYKPDLAICVYHKPNHLWEVLLRINTISSDYKFFLRNYTGYPAETVLYCTQ